MRLASLVWRLLDLPAGGWRVLARVALLYCHGDDSIRGALVSQIEVLERLVPRSCEAACCRRPGRQGAVSIMLSPTPGGGLDVHRIQTARIHVLDPGP